MYSHSSTQSEELSYFSLIEKVGTKGRYQWIIYFLIFSYWIMNGYILFCISFFFLNPGFDCTTLSVSKINCEAYICSHFPADQRMAYEGVKTMESLVTEYGPFHCQQNYGVGLMRAIANIGMTVGMAIVTFFMEKVSERKSILYALLSQLVGSIILSGSSSIIVACIGLFFLGFGSFIQIRLGASLLNQFVEEKLAEKFLGTLMGGTTIGGLIATGSFWWLKDWRHVGWIFLTLPSLIYLIFTYIFLQQTPKFLLKTKDIDKICQSLNKIGWINTGIDNLVNKGQIEDYLKSQISSQKTNSSYSFKDLFTYPSLRCSTIAFCLLILCLDFIYLSHSVVINNIGFNPTLNQFLISSVELIAVITNYFFNSWMPRKRSGQVIFLICTIIGLVACKTQIPSNCQKCTQLYIQMAIILISRFLIVSQSCIFFINLAEFYPTCVKYIGFALTGFFSAFASVVVQFVMVDSGELGVNPFLIITFSSLCIFFIYFNIPQTLNLGLKDQIEEVRSRRDND